MKNTELQKINCENGKLFARSAEDQIGHQANVYATLKLSRSTSSINHQSCARSSHEKQPAGLSHDETCPPFLFCQVYSGVARSASHQV
jgi:hypothetical protein